MEMIFMALLTSFDSDLKYFNRLFNVSAINHSERKPYSPCKSISSAADRELFARNTKSAACWL
jgi:hypothetical protein